MFHIRYISFLTKKTCIGLVSIHFCICCWAQGGEWTWLKGDSARNRNGVYGTMGTEAATNKPGSRDGQFTWTDNSGNLWMFGGDGYANSGVFTYLSDLWKYNISTNNWTWVKGDSAGSKYSNYGIRGVSAAANKPGYRWTGACWVNSSGNFLSFGGMGNDQAAPSTRLSDLWQYNPTTNEWTWLKGDTLSDRNGVYGTKGTPAAANNPGARHAPGNWKDASGNLWLFGGFGNAASGATQSQLNDLWKYDPTTDNWTWINGDSVRNKNGVYGTKGVAAASNKPGSRYAPLSWQDVNGIFYLMGGHGYPGSGTTANVLNDVWKYNTSTSLWTWIGGDSVFNTTGANYGTKCTLATTNKPGGRRYGATWLDNTTSDFWMMGGDGYGNGSGTKGYLNDMFAYDVSGDKWVWVNGNTTINNFGVYGTKGVTAATNTPGARYHLTRTDWIDAAGNLYLLGGYGYSTPTVAALGYLNDMWKFKVSGACNSTLPIELISFSGENKEGKNELSWTTASEVNNDHFILERSIDGLNFKEFAKITGGGNTSSLSKYRETDPEPFNLTYYRLKNVDYDGKYDYSKVIVLTNDNRNNLSNGDLSVYPTPSDGDKIYLRFKGQTSEEKVLVILIDVLGQTVYSKVTFTDTNGNILEAIDETQKLTPGIYTVIGSVRDKVYNQRLVIK